MNLSLKKDPSNGRKPSDAVQPMTDVFVIGRTKRHKVEAAE